MENGKLPLPEWLLLLGFFIWFLRIGFGSGLFTLVFLFNSNGSTSVKGWGLLRWLALQDSGLMAVEIKKRSCCFIFLILR